jgi:hypothetical protein
MAQSITRLFFILFIPFYSQASNLDCKDLKEGTFRLENEDGSGQIIVRTKYKQRENDPKTGVVSEMDIKWLSDCCYILFNRHLIEGVDDSTSDLKIDSIFNEITEIKGDKHKVSSKIKQLDFTIEATLIKVNTSLLY